jgi:predicted O-methyltransferase YrrM
MALKENGIGRLYAVDPHTSTNWNDSDSVDTYDILRRHLGELNLTEVVSIVRQSSVEALSGVPKPIDFLFIDGDHSYEGVKSDWQLFTPHMTAFGVVVFHDTTWDLRPESKWFRADMGVPRFIDELRRQGYPVLTIDRDYGVSMVQPSIGGVSLSPQNSSASL